jgi:glutamate racemase
VSKQGSIGIFDSGIGGLSIAEAIHKLLPSESLIYYADNANFPYGTKTPDQIKRIALAATRQLIEADCKLIVVACNTATTAAIGYLRDSLPGVLIVGVVPMIKSASKLSHSGVVAVMMTPATLAGDYYHDLKLSFAPDVRVIDVACPDWVEMVESGDIDEVVVRGPVEKVLAQGADVILLGCTHFPLLLPQIERAVAGRAVVVHPAEAVARQVAKILDEQDLMNDLAAGSISYLSSGDIMPVEQAGKRLMGELARDL